MTDAVGKSDPRITPQAVVRPLTRAAIFLVVTVNPGRESLAGVRALCADLPKLTRAVGFREPEGNLSCVTGFGSEAWDRLFGQPRPAELHPFREIGAAPRHAVATPGDLLFHIRAERDDLCFELATQIMAEVGRRGLAGGRGPRFPLLRCARPARIRRRDGESRQSGGDRRHFHRRRRIRRSPAAVT